MTAPATHPDVAFAAGGRIFGDGAETRASCNDFGDPVFQLLVSCWIVVSTEITGGGIAPCVRADADGTVSGADRVAERRES